MIDAHDERSDSSTRPAAQMRRIGLVLVGLTMTAGCVQVTAPTEPIEINLNINIRQEVVYRLDSDTRQIIEQNAEIF